MTTDFAGNATKYPALVETPSDGESRNASTVQTPLEQLADRTAALDHGARQAVRNWSATSGATLQANSGTPTFDGVAGNKTWWLAVGDATSTETAVYFSSHGGSAWEKNGSVGGTVTYLEVSWDEVNQLWIVVGNGGLIHTFPFKPSVVETVQTSNASATLQAVHTNVAGVTVAAGEHDGSDQAASVSPDGTTWTAVAMAGSAGSIAQGLASSGTTFVAVGETSGAVPLIWVSVNSGTSFSVVSIPAGLTDALVSVTYDGTVFVALGDDGQIATSITGLTGTWTKLTGPSTDWSAGGGRTISADPASGAMLAHAGSVSSLYYSYDSGVTWAKVDHTPGRAPEATAATPLAGPFWDALGFDGSAWVVVRNEGANDYVYGAQSMVIG